MRKDQMLSVVRENGGKKFWNSKTFINLHIKCNSHGALKYEKIRRRKLNLVEQKSSLMVKYAVRCLTPRCNERYLFSDIDGRNFVLVFSTRS